MKLAGAFTHNGSVLSPRPYKLGDSGSFVLSLKYWDSKTICAADVSKSTSPVFLLVTEKLNGLAT